MLLWIIASFAVAVTVEEMRSAAKDMCLHGYNNYMTLAFPRKILEIECLT
jgi:hypothetical protein